MVSYKLCFNFFLYIIKTSENERYLNEKCFFFQKKVFYRIKTVNLCAQGKQLLYYESYRRRLVFVLMLSDEGEW